MTDAPNEVLRGKIIASLYEFIADSNDNEQPDLKGLNGTVTLSPTVKFVRLPDLATPFTAMAGQIVCPVIEGQLYAPGTTANETIGSNPKAPGVWVISTTQPSAQPSTFQWTATFVLKGMAQAPQPVTFNLENGETVDLTTVVPTTPQVSTVYVVTKADYNAAVAANVAAQDAMNSVPPTLTVTQAEYDALTPDSETYYLFTD